MKILSIAFIFCGNLVFAQEVIGSAGETFSNGSLIVDYTLGETVIFTGSDGTNDLTQGFHQTKWQFVGVEEFQISFEASVYPNPTSDLLIISVQDFQDLSYQMYDSQGKLVRNGEIKQSESIIAVQELSQGQYSLSIIKNSNPVKQFTLVKLP